MQQILLNHPPPSLIDHLHHPHDANHPTTTRGNVINNNNNNQMPIIIIIYMCRVIHRLLLKCTLFCSFSKDPNLMFEIN